MYSPTHSNLQVWSTAPHLLRWYAAYLPLDCLHFPSCKASCSEAQDLHHIEHSILHPCYQCNGTGSLMCLSGGCFPATEIQGSCWQVRSSREASVCLALSIQSGTLSHPAIPCNTCSCAHPADLPLCTPCTLW